MIKTEWRKNCDDQYVRANYGWHMIEGNPGPYFSITGEIAEEWLGRIVSCGCIHKEIANMFPELAVLIPYHGVYNNGLPFHYEANAKYWMEKHLGTFKLFPNSPPEGRRSYEPDPLETFKSHILYNSIPSDKMSLESFLKTKSWREFDQWLKRRGPFLKKKMELIFSSFPEIKLDIECSG